MELIPQENANGKYGFVDENGNWVIEPQFDDAYGFFEGLAGVKVSKKWGFIRQDGTWAIEPQFGEIWETSSGGKAEVKLDGKYVNIHINPDGSWDIE